LKTIKVADHTIKVDEEDYLLLSRHTWSVAKAGNVYYAVTSIGDRSYSYHMHRMILGNPPSRNRMIDHINGDGLDNKKENLRFVTNSENQQNRRHGSLGGSSKYRGVFFVRRDSKWQAQIKKDGRSIYLGAVQNRRRRGNSLRQESFGIIRRGLLPKF